LLDREKRRRYLSEAFHALAQPITGLQCGLEVAIAKPRTETEYKKRIGAALEVTSTFRELAAALRDLTEADDVGEHPEKLHLPTFFIQLCESLERLADLHETTLMFNCVPPVNVDADCERLLKTLVFLGDQLLKTEGNVQFTTRDLGLCVEITLKETSGEKSSRLRNPESVIRLNAAENYLETIGGRLSVIPNGYVITLPVAKV
jgi:hypothetical protein